MTIIESDRYAATRDELADDPIIQAMSREIADDAKTKPDLLGSLADSDGSPTFEFMTRALNEYRARGGEVQTHIGGPAQVILQQVKNLKEHASPEGQEILASAIRAYAQVAADEGQKQTHPAAAEAMATKAAIATVLDALLQAPSQKREDMLYDLLDRAQS